MPPRETIAYALAALGVLGAAWFGLERTQSSARLREMQDILEDRGRKAESLRQEVAGARQAVAAARTESERERAAAAAALKDAQDRLAAAEKALQALKAAPAAQAPPPAKGRKKGGFGQMMAMGRKMMDTPAMKEQMRQGMRLQVAQLYGDLFKEWVLEGEARQRVEDLLIDRLLGQMDLGMMMGDAEIGEEEILRRQEEVLARSGAALAGALSEAQRARLEAYDRELPDRVAAQQADQQLAALGLQGGQAEPVRAILLEEQRALQVDLKQRFAGLQDPGAPSLPGERLGAEEVRRTRAMLQGEGPDPSELFKAMADARERTLARVQPLLTPEQFATLRKQEEAKAQMMEMGLRMMQAAGDQAP